MNSLLKEGEELFIKMSNGQFKRINEVIKVDNTITYPKINELPNFKFRTQRQFFNQKIDLNSINKEFANCLNQDQGFSPCRIENFSSVIQNNPSLVQSFQLDPTRKICQQVKFPESTIQMQNIILQNQNLIANEKKLNEEPTRILENSKTSIWLDEHFMIYIQNQILESHNITINRTVECDLEETEGYIKSEVHKLHTKSKYTVIYMCIIFPLLIIFYNQNKEFSKFNDWEAIRNYSFMSTKNKQFHKTRSFTLESNYFERLGRGISQNLVDGRRDSSADAGFESTFISKITKIRCINNSQNIFVKIISKILYFLTGICLSEINSDYSFNYLPKFYQNLASNSDYHLSCKSWEEFSCLHFPTHDHLYSTDEASSSDADFLETTTKRGKGRVKKNRKGGKSNKHSS